MLYLFLVGREKSNLKKFLIFLTLIVILVPLLFLGIDLYMDKKAKDIIDDKIFAESNASYDSVDFSLWDRSITIKNVFIHYENGTFFAESIHIYKYDDSLNMDVLLKNIKGVQGDMEKAYVNVINSLREYGYEDVTIDMRFEMSTDKDKNIGDIKRFEFIVSSAFSINFFMKVGNFDPTFWINYATRDSFTEEEMIEILSEMGAMKLIEIGVSFRDDGFKERYINKVAEKKSKDPMEVKKEMKESINKMVESTEHPSAKEVLKKISYFLDKGKFIKLYIQPKKPLKFQDIIIFFAVNYEKGTDPTHQFLEQFNIEAEVF